MVRGNDQNSNLPYLSLTLGLVVRITSMGTSCRTLPMRKRLEENIGDQATYGPAGRSNMNHEDCKELFEAGQTLLN